ncbi:MAG: AAA family ATPase [Lachnospiraceae bacterium]|nr:AAA family ATPase [Lachnospiraceae bacterium]
MKDWMTCREAASLWNVTERWVSGLCSSGKLAGAVKNGRKWLIPADTAKPMDSRIKTGKYIKSRAETKKLPLPVGISDYCKAQSDYYYVDKTLFIRDLLDQKPFVSLFTRPRRFGKTLNMNMLRVFFEKSETDTSIYFRNKNIWKCGPEYQKHQGHYPVIFLTFKDVKFKTWDETLEKLRELFQKEYGRHQELGSSTRIAEYEKNYYRKILSGSASMVEMTSALSNLSQMLHEHHQVAPIIIIDEYDTPIQQGYSQHYYDDIILFMRNLFSGAFKDNLHLSYGS